MGEVSEQAAREGAHALVKEALRELDDGGDWDLIEALVAATLEMVKASY